MKEAMYYGRLNGKIMCKLCPNNCIINKTGICGVRKVINNKLYSLVYGKACSAAVDPIEKKPLFHYLPSHNTFSISTVGCNFSCLHCQNFEISQEKSVYGKELMPEKIIELAKQNGCKSISYTYTEPTVFYEYVLETARQARKAGIKNVIVSNGYINPKPLDKWCNYIDAANIDLKAFDDDFYKKICSGRLEPVLNTLKTLSKKKVWFEITNLIIPTLNDNTVEEMCTWIVDNLGKNVPVHFSRFHPMYKLNYLPLTPTATLEKSRETALKTGIKHVYIGNIRAGKAENTYCPECGKQLIKRSGFNILECNLSSGRCSCNEQISGIWS
ncbi:MAG: AmmeMemoRadiSam system radical SAM enzyme [Nanoarchaeota archaeon]